MRLFVLLALLLAVISLAHAAKGIPAGDKPTYKDCQPHIDATIRDLAAKAVHAGEEPSEPDDLEYDAKQDDSDEADSAEDNSAEDNIEEFNDEIITKIYQEAKRKESHHDSKPQEKSVKDHHKKAPEEKNKYKHDYHQKSRKEEKDKKASKTIEKKSVKKDFTKHHSDKSQKDEPKSEKTTEKPDKDKKSYEKEKKKGQKDVKQEKKDKKPDHKQMSVKSGTKTSEKHHQKTKPDTKEKPTQAHKSHHKTDARKEHDKSKKAEKEEKHQEKPQKQKEEPKPEKKQKAEEVKKHVKLENESNEEIIDKPAELKKDQGRKEVKIGIFDKFVDIIFGLPTHDRDVKYTKPWNTHPEFAKIEANKKDIVLKTKHSGPGLLSRLFNKCVMKIFNLEEVKRDEKWAQPWQTHSEHKKKEKPKVEKVKDNRKPWEKSWINFSFMNKFVEIIFGKVDGKRDPKYAQPWQTHPEFRKTGGSKSKPPTKKDVKEIKKEIAKSHDKGGIINYLVSLVFEIPTGKRDAKWAKPWQSHQEFAKRGEEKEAQKKSKEKVKVGKAGIISQAFNKFVYLIFEKVEGKRDAKWTKPWQTHEEHQRKSKEKAEKIVVEKKKNTESGIIGKALNSFVQLIFPVHEQKRDAKWEQPWVSHKEHKALKFKKKEETSKESIPQPKKEAEKPHKETLNGERKQQKEPLKEGKKTEKAPVQQDSPKEPKKEETPEPEIKHYTKPISIKKEDIAEPSPRKEESKRKHEEHKEKEHHEKKYHKKDEEEKHTKPVKIDERKYKEKIFEDDEQVVVVPTHVRSRDHIDEIFSTIDHSSRSETAAKNALNELKGIYDGAVKPLETTFMYQDISNRHMTDAELYGPPMILLLGPYSTGKSSFINYLLDIEFTRRALKTGTPPSHGVFRILQYGEHDRELDGTDVGGQFIYSSLQKFGQNFVDQIKGKSLRAPLLKKVTFVEVPGILEMRRPNERLYPFNDVLQWFIDRADIILVMFDYTKLDAGYEMEAILDQLKGREAQTRILLNKADQVPPEELIKVQGSLFWNLSPLLGVSSPPAVYAGSYASFPYRPTSPIKLFQAQEEALLHDIAKAINSRIENRIAIVRRHAVRVRNHAQMVDTYLSTFYNNKGFLTSKLVLADDIIENPHAYNIYEGITLQTNVSRYDLPDAEIYRDFFKIHKLYNFKTLRQTCSFVGVCPLEKIDTAINKQLPQLMSKYKQQRDSAKHDSSLPHSIKAGKTSEGGSHAHSQKL